MEPEVIIFDEPTAGLDPARSSRIVDFLDRLNERGTTVIMSTHDVNLAFSWSDYCFLLNEGKKTAEGRTVNLFQNNNLLKEVNLEKPGVLKIFETLKRTDLVDGNGSPRNEEDLIRMIERNSSELSESEES
ncbi:AAA family ATPase, partial [Candidatus Bipolaricaulota bacterium]|nr:AAA family ATPase [Candidatus Bipolaricaulota bacterium]